MIFNLRTLTIVHVVISLLGIGSGFVVMIRAAHRHRTPHLDGDLPVDHTGNECDWIPLSIPEVYAGNWRRHRIDDRTGTRHPCAVCL